MTSNNIMKNLANGRFFYEVLNAVRSYTCNDFGETPFQLWGGARILSPPFLWGDACLVCSGRHPVKKQVLWKPMTFN